MRAMYGMVVIAWVMVAVGGCGGVLSSLNAPAGILPANTSFIMSGKAEAVEPPSVFPTWRAPGGGQAFVLFQTSAVSNADFNTITTAGTESRLELTVRNDLSPLVQSFAIPVDVERILEINGVSRSQQ